MAAVAAEVSKRGLTWSARRCHVVPSSMRTYGENAIANEATCSVDQGGPGRKVLAFTGASSSGKGLGLFQLLRMGCEPTVGVQDVQGRLQHPVQQ